MKLDSAYTKKSNKSMYALKISRASRLSKTWGYFLCFELCSHHNHKNLACLLSEKWNIINSDLLKYRLEMLFSFTCVAKTRWRPASLGRTISAGAEMIMAEPLYMNGQAALSFFFWASNTVSWEAFKQKREKWSIRQPSWEDEFPGCLIHCEARFQ